MNPSTAAGILFALCIFGFLIASGVGAARRLYHPTKETKTAEKSVKYH